MPGLAPPRIDNKPSRTMFQARSLCPSLLYSAVTKNGMVQNILFILFFIKKSLSEDGKRSYISVPCLQTDAGINLAFLSFKLTLAGICQGFIGPVPPPLWIENVEYIIFRIKNTFIIKKSKIDVNLFFSELTLSSEML